MGCIGSHVRIFENLRIGPAHAREHAPVLRIGGARVRERSDRKVRTPTAIGRPGVEQYDTSSASQARDQPPACTVRSCVHATKQQRSLLRPAKPDLDSSTLMRVSGRAALTHSCVMPSEKKVGDHMRPWRGDALR